MKLNNKEDFVKSFWPYTEEEEDEMFLKAFAERMRREGKAEGEAAGKKMGIMQTAKNMLKEKCDINLIRKVTKLSKAEIKALM